MGALVRWSLFFYGLVVSQVVEMAGKENAITNNYTNLLTNINIRDIMRGASMTSSLPRGSLKETVLYDN